MNGESKVLTRKVKTNVQAMLSGPGQFEENETNEVNFREIPSHVLQKVCMYFTYKVKNNTK